jgi:signal transduction histidine kinase
VKEISDDVALIGGIPAVPGILDVVCRTTGMGFAAVARVTGDRWVACSVLDKIDFGLKVGGELKLETTICHEIRAARREVVIDHVELDETYRDHHTPRMYGFQSYISIPIVLPGGEFFGTLCAIDPRPARVKTPEVIGMFKLFAELIAFHIDAAEKLASSQSTLHAARETSDLREQFIGVLGHDLRNPLGAISMSAGLLKTTSLNDEQAMAVGIVERGVTRMSELINDALDFTRGRLGGGISLETRSDEPVEPVLRQVIEEIRTVAPGRGIEEHFALQGSFPFDRRRMAQLFTNLLSNAVTHGKATRPITVRAASGEGVFRLSVSNASDTIPPAILKQLFEPFSRGGKGNYQRGLGLGLYIASQIAKSHGGTLAVVSEEGETTFTFTLVTGRLP